MSKRVERTEQMAVEYWGESLTGGRRAHLWISIPSDSARSRSKCGMIVEYATRINAAGEKLEKDRSIVHFDFQLAK